MTARRLILLVVWFLGSLVVMILGGLDQPRSGGADGPRGGSNLIPFGIDLQDWPLIAAWVVFTGYLAWLFIRRDRNSD